MRENTKRQIYIDYLRVLATVFVIGVHTVSLAATMVTPDSLAYDTLEIFDFIFLSCNLLFVMISGALLLPVRNEKPGTFFRKRFMKVVIPMVVYYILYICAKEGIQWIYPDHWLPMLRRILLGAPVEAPHFWLIYVIIWLYVLTPFVRFLMANISDAVLTGVIGVVFVVCAIDTYLPYFGVTSPFSRIVDTCIGIFLLGYFLSGKCSRKGERVFLFLGAGSLIVTIVMILTYADYANYIYQNAPTMLFFTAAIFILVRRLCKYATTVPALVQILGKHSYSILLIHWGILHFVVKQKLHVNVLSGGIWGGCLLMMTLTLILSALGAISLDLTLFKFIDWLLSGRWLHKIKKEQ